MYIRSTVEIDNDFFIRIEKLEESNKKTKREVINSLIRRLRIRPLSGAGMGESPCRLKGVERACIIDEKEMTAPAFDHLEIAVGTPDVAFPENNTISFNI